ncbi:MAG: hypothetical protein NZ990_01445, partial [Myxococcota bacterium]|nr:hypothetical protein [Myxococcota bacterium]
STLSEALEQAAESAKQNTQRMIGDMLTAEQLKFVDKSTIDQQMVQARRAIEMATIRTLDLGAECKLADGKPMEAIAVWQGILDTYPTQQDYSLYEAKIVEVLGE